MSRPVGTRLDLVRPAAAVLAAAALTLAATPARAQHRARLSADLADHLAHGSQSIEIIVHGSRAEIDDLAARYNLRVRKYLKDAAVLEVNAGQLSVLQSDTSIDHLSGDIPIRPSDVTTETIGADQVWRGAEGLPPLSGAGVVVAVIDSGIDPRHNALKGRVVFTKDYTGGNGSDRYGHGTHVAALIAGQAGRTKDTRTYSGVAPGAYLVNLRVLGDDGSGRASDVVDAIDWAIDHAAQYRIRVINLSLGAPVLQPYRDDPLCEAVERAVEAGLVVVAAAGNFGKTADGVPVRGGIVSPGNSPWAITVGAIDTQGTPQRSDDVVASYSSRGPTRYDLVLKPDVVAPGSHVVSAEADGSYLATTYSTRHVTGSGPNAYIQLSGTSMAAGVVSGAVALLLEERPASLNPFAAKSAIQLTSSFLRSAGLVGSGAGIINVLAAVEFVWFEIELPTTSIAGERVSSSGLSTKLVSSDILVWGSDKILVWGSTDILVWGNILVWGASDILVWGNSDILVWGSSDILVWGNSDILVWGNSNILVWGATDILVWGN